MTLVVAHFVAGIPCVTDSVIAELEKLGPKFRIALRLAKDPRFLRIPTEGTYADDDIVNIVTEVCSEHTLTLNCC